jgi:ribosomal protein S18 acetylase RimI-like enzyme
MMRENVKIEDVAAEDRFALEPILDEAFSGLYLWHAKRTLRNIEVVRAAKVGGESVGLVMLKKLTSKAGYVYYIAVAPTYRGKGVAGQLLDHSLQYFAELGAKQVYASVEESNRDSLLLFGSRGFRPIGFAELSKKYGRLEATKMYAEMLVVHGETLLSRELNQTPPVSPRF